MTLLMKSLWGSKSILLEPKSPGATTDTTSYLVNPPFDSGFHPREFVLSPHWAIWHCKTATHFANRRSYGAKPP